MTHDEAIKTIRSALLWMDARYDSCAMVTNALAALDSLAETSEQVECPTIEEVAGKIVLKYHRNGRAYMKECTDGRWGDEISSCPMYPSIPLAMESKPLDPTMQAVVQENFWELEGKPKAVEPSEEARELVEAIQGIGHDSASCRMISAKKAAALITADRERIEAEAYQRGYDRGYAARRHDDDWSKVEANL